ncbi:hypothetical protein FKM82_011584 [Ascaphus truei]
MHSTACSPVQSCGKSVRRATRVLTDSTWIYLLHERTPYGLATTGEGFKNKVQAVADMIVTFPHIFLLRTC